MAVNLDARNQVYNHYVAEYAPKTNTPLDTHKKSDLRKIYNSIVKLNKESPLYLLDTSKEAKSYAVGLKESARAFRNAVAATSSSIGDEDVLDQKIAYSSKPEIASAKYIGDSTGGALAPTFSLSVAQLASPQTNVGHALKSDDRVSLPPDSYSFDLSINDFNYEFQFQLKEEDTNKEVQERLQRLINNADIGIEASILEDTDGNSSLKLTSTASGKVGDRDIFFHISDENTSMTRGIVDYLGMNRLATPAQNALFEINGIERTATSNTFSVEKAYEVTLQGLSTDPGDVTQIGLKNDVDSLSENIHALADSYNQFVKDISNAPGAHAKSSQLLTELSYITRHYAPNLDALGLNFEQDGTLQVDDDKLQTAAADDNAKENFGDVKDFANAMLRKSNQISLNPMEYINKTIVAYKNPGKNFPNPYVTSNYSGMLFNNYC